MIHVVDFEKTAFSTPFRGVLPSSGQQIITEGWQGVLQRGQGPGRYPGQKKRSRPDVP